MRTHLKTAQTALSLDELRAFSAVLTPGSLLRKATLLVIAEREQQVCSTEPLHKPDLP